MDEGISRLSRDLADARLEAAKRFGAETINFEETKTYEALLEMTGGIGPDAVIDAVGLEAHGFFLTRRLLPLRLPFGRGLSCRLLALGLGKGFDAGSLLADGLLLLGLAPDRGTPFVLLALGLQSGGLELLSLLIDRGRVRLRARGTRRDDHHGGRGRRRFGGGRCGE